MSTSVKKVIQYFAVLTVSFHDINSLFGFFTFLTIASQLISGTMLAFSFVTEPMIVPMVREEEDVEDLYTDDFFWLHERGVDLLFIFTYFHLFRKLYINCYDYDQEASWKSGVFTFLLFQGVVFFGLVLCCTHLSDITLAIASNLYDTFFAHKGKFYWWIFTSKELNTDTVIRLAYIHYVLAFFLSYMGLVHGIDMHYDWKNEASMDGIETEMIWFDEALSNELGAMIEVIVLLLIICLVVYPEPEALSYELFMWGDIGFINDVRFLSVAPHWYFRPFMAWLTVCPFHKIGLFGLIYYFFLLFYQPVIQGLNNSLNYKKKPSGLSKLIINRSSIVSARYYSIEDNLVYQITYWLFLSSCIYVTSYLPYGRFYNRINGNHGTLLAFMYIFVYLSSPSLRRSIFVDLYIYNQFVKIDYLKRVNN